MRSITITTFLLVAALTSASDSTPKPTTTGKHHPGWFKTTHWQTSQSGLEGLDHKSALPIDIDAVAKVKNILDESKDRELKI